MLQRWNKFLIAIALGFLLYVLTGVCLIVVRWHALTENEGELLNSLSVNFLTDVAFFSLVGAAGGLAQFYGERGDVLKQRLRKVFANHTVSLPVIDFFEEIARNSAVYATHAEHIVTVLEFREDYFAYRAEFQNIYHLKNAFGDISYDADLTVEIAPDISRSVNSTLAMITKIRITTNGEPCSFIEKPTKVGPQGFKRPLRITVPPNGEALLEMQWWSWVEASGDWDSGFSMKRFSERFSVTLVNKAPLPLQVSRGIGRERITLSSGDEFKICDEPNVPPKTRFEFFWYPPAGTHPPENLDKGVRSTHLLDFDQKVGEHPEKFL